MNLFHGISDYYTDVIEGNAISSKRSSRYTTFELAGIIATAALKFIMMDWLNMVAFYIAGICLFWIAYIIYRSVNDRTILEKWGFRKDGFSHTILFLFPFIIFTALSSIIIGEANTSISILNWRVIPVLFLYPLWGLFQQYIMLVLIAGNLTELDHINLKKYQVIIITSLLFSSIHYPSFLLMVFTFFMEIIFLLAWFRWKNLLAMGLAHGLIATLLLFYILERDLWLELFEWF
ncbi:MAG TPA: CPBP family intramembrane metalloprotease [Bacteroidales bacterium]|nr:CPBP family intramembrane metalloprotease [Bacteroidales bacterium]